MSPSVTVFSKMLITKIPIPSPERGDKSRHGILKVELRSMGLLPEEPPRLTQVRVRDESLRGVFGLVGTTLHELFAAKRYLCYSFAVPFLRHLNSSFSHESLSALAR